MFERNENELRRGSEMILSKMSKRKTVMSIEKTNYSPADVTRQALHFRKGIYLITQLSFSIIDDAGGYHYHHITFIPHFYLIKFSFSTLIIKFRTIDKIKKSNENESPMISNRIRLLISVSVSYLYKVVIIIIIVNVSIHLQDETFDNQTILKIFWNT